MRFLFLIPVLMLVPSVSQAVTADDVVCNKCVQQKDIDFGAIGTGRLQKQSVTSDRLAPDAVGMTAIDPTEVQVRVGGECPFGSAISAINEDGSIQCSNLIMATVSSTDSQGQGISAVDCPAGTAIMSANCSCESANNTRNLGTLFFCQVSSNSGLVGCLEDYPIFNPTLPPPFATVTAVCLGVNVLEDSQASQGIGVLQQQIEQVRGDVVRHQSALRSRQ